MGQVVPRVRGSAAAPVMVEVAEDQRTSDITLTPPQPPITRSVPSLSRHDVMTSVCWCSRTTRTDQDHMTTCARRPDQQVHQVHSPSSPVPSRAPTTTAKPVSPFFPRTLFLAPDARVTHTRTKERRIVCGENEMTSVLRLNLKRKLHLLTCSSSPFLLVSPLLPLSSH